ncbi:MAG: crossover junction endodeoxyribonuclease RuvC [Rhodospirillaceae bacterium]|jgi:crossover junction endodeoxyribonuclease RuvC|nr:crossover junction endodeoxyribonuclease RuvC [Rhodospirillaceae bacterium]MBT5359405.1 crossover junction endodeoxyribonuclease RuvC [Rhodospirillaceae bacterium]MBT5768402.1 crossover junction endodeoxyribonuclease RuvC [Rhodospirillaceae bacterium]MBT6309567.1 crossover junction endodeoxyribonuclease RuvC [Rhodospirillaceae bacterium]MBT7363756.1 crossover junction endodeoxyribonuclease RuvC [Rhodospirillaceae bacterium]
MRLLGVDPGLRFTGWGVVDMDGNRLRHVANGVVKSGSGELAQRLVRLHHGLQDVISEHQPDSAAVEETFVNRDGQATLKLGQARGIALLVPALAGIPVAEYAANSVKKSVVGYGHADKNQIGHMIGVLLPGALVESPDAADALAIAICHAHHMGAQAIYEAAQ